MKFATYFDGTPRIGVADGSEMWDLRALYSRYLFETERNPNHAEIAAAIVPHDMAMFLRLHHGALGRFQEAFEYVKEDRDRIFSYHPTASAALVRPLDECRFLPPVMTPSKVVCIGSSYESHLEEFGLPRERWPQDVKISFFKSPAALIGHRDTLRYPPDSEKWDYENELTIVIGRTCSDVSEKDADKYIFGYSVVNDACVRDLPVWQGLDSPRGKAPDTLAPFGPWIVPTEHLGADPNELHFKTFVDGKKRQDDCTSNLTWTTQRIVAFVSRYMRLLPGDIIPTGSAPGNAMADEQYLKVGQVVRCEMEGIGVLENTVGVRKWTSKLKALSKST